MPKLTIDLPDDLMPALTEKASGWQQTPESYLTSFVVMSLEREEEDDALVYADPTQQRLEEILEERDKGPFIPLPRDWKEQVMAKARVHVATVNASKVSHV